MDDAAVVAFIPLARSLAARMAWLPEHQEDLAQAGIFALLKAARSTTVTAEASFAQTVMRRAMQDCYSVHDRQDHFLQPTEDAPLPIQGVQTRVEQVELEEYYREVGRILGPEAERMARELVEPSEGTTWFVLYEMREKQKRKAAGERVRGANTPVLRHEHVRRHLKIQEERWYAELRRLRRFTRDWLETNAGAA